MAKNRQQDSEYAVDCPTFRRRDLGADVTSASVAFLDDAHTANECSDLDGLLETVSTILETPHMYAFVGGDVLENALHTSKSASYNTKMSPLNEQKWVLDKVLLPLADKGRILGVTDSNHSVRTDNQAGIDPIEQLVERVNAEVKGVQPPIPYEKSGIWVGATLGKRPNNGKPFCYGVYYHHGWSAGRRAGTPLNAATDIMRWLGADVIVLGHSHGKAGTKSRRFDPDWANGRFVNKNVACGVTGGYLLYGGYARARGYAPQEEGATIVRLSGTRKEAKIVL